MPPQTAKEMILDAHEDRIQRLEEGHSQFAAQVATLTERVDGGFDHLSEKLDRALTPIGKMVDQIGKHQVVLAEIEEKAAKAKARREGAKKHMWTVIVAGAGVLVKELAVTFWNLLHHL